MPRWQIFCAVALRRLPELVPRMNSIESKVQAVYNAYEVAKSKLSNHELQHIEDTRLKESDDPDIVIKETALDKEDQWMKEKEKFQFGEYDDSLTYTKYLFLNQKFGTDIKSQWLLPQAFFDNKLDEDFLHTARRALKESLGITNGYKLVSKIPSSVYSFRYPKKIVQQTNYNGAKVFFLKAQLDNPSSDVTNAIDEAKNQDKLKWLTKDEAFREIHNRYMTSLNEGLLNEKRVDVDKVLSKALTSATLRTVIKK